MPQLTDTQLLEFQTMRRVELTPEYEGPWDAKVYGEGDKPEAIFTGSTPREALAAAATAFGVGSPAAPQPFQLPRPASIGIGFTTEQVHEIIRQRDAQWAGVHGVGVDGELNTGSVPERLNGDALRSGREAGCKQKGPVARAADTGSFVGSNPTAAHSAVDWLGLALDLEAQAKRVESQTVERAMLAGAHGLRLMGAHAAGVRCLDAGREAALDALSRMKDAVAAAAEAEPGLVGDFKTVLHFLEQLGAAGVGGTDGR